MSDDVMRFEIFCTAVPYQIATVQRYIYNI